MKNKITSILLVIITAFLIVPILLPQKVNAVTTAPETFELDGSVFKIEHDENLITVSEYRDDIKVSTSTYDKAKEAVTIVDSENLKTEYTLDELKNEYPLNSDSNFSVMSTNVNIKSRFSAYQYRQSGNWYTLTISDGGAKSKSVYYSRTVAGYLTSFRRNIEDIRSGGMAVIGALGLDMAAAVIGGLFTGGIGTVIAIVGTLPSIIAAGNIIIKASNRAREDYYAI